MFFLEQENKKSNEYARARNYLVLVQGIVKENRIHNEDEMLNEE